MLGLLNLFGNIFGTSKSFARKAEDVANAVSKFAGNDADKQAKMLEASAAYIDSTKGQNLARRLIAVAVVFTWLGAVILSAVLASFGYDVEANTIRGILNDLSNEVMVVFAFYFCAGGVNKLGDVYLAAKRESNDANRQAALRERS